MTTNTRKWLKGLGAAFIGGGASAVTSGLTSMGVAPDRFNMTDWAGVSRLLVLIAANFLISGILSMFFFLRQSPLPADGDTQFVTKPSTPPTV